MIKRKIKDLVYLFIGTLGYAFGYKLKSPVFIIGTGRCGSTLLLRILRSHKRLAGLPTEANELWHPKSYPFSRRTIETISIMEGPKKFTDISIENWPENQVRKIKRRFIGYSIARNYRKKFFVKSAMISFMIPQILSIFPDAKFIHIYRNGPSVVESFLKKEWIKFCNHFDSEQEYRLHCAKYWSDCMLEIDKQNTDLSMEKKGILLEFSYEELCENPIEVMNNLSDFFSIDMNDFNFDSSQVSSQNFKVGDFSKDKKWSKLLKIMEPGMKLKGFLS